jgi:benzoyl-CoA-dihydrodiol lyase
VLAADALMDAHASHWFVRETIGMLRRTLARLDVSSRSCSRWSNRAPALPARCWNWRWPRTAPTCCNCPTRQTKLPRSCRRRQLRPLSDAERPDAPGRTLLRRCQRHRRRARTARQAARRPAAEALGLVTAALDDIDWEDEIRIAIEERASLSPDALTGLEANLRFGGRETWKRASSAA